MKRCVLLAIAFVLLLCLTACAVFPEDNTTETTAPAVTEPEVTEPDVTDPDVTEPDVTDPDVIEDLVYDMSNYEWFSDIFEEKDIEHWNAMGHYTIHLGGLHTPVVVNMDGTSVLSISAFDQTVDLGTDGMADDYHDGYSPVYSIRSTEDAVVIRVSFGEMGDGSIVITSGKSFIYPKESGYRSQSIYVNNDGTLGFYQETTLFLDFEQTLGVALGWATSRDEVLYRSGAAAIIDGELVLTVEKTVVLSDRYDLDAMFAEAKAYGMFTEYETADELFAANKASEDER